MKVVSVLFSGSPNRYDYFCQDDAVRVGDEVVVETRRGDATVVVAAVKDQSDKATAYVKRVVGRPEISGAMF